ncbi:MAG: hypothetical protein JWN70_5349 [Planctomycetaceae bacterium]|nr:hypothetical protein [Planctomycetaceae bacterium]
MRKSAVLFLLMLAVMAVALHSPNESTLGQVKQSVPIPKWEYMVVSGDAFPTRTAVLSMQNRFNELGKEGWEISLAIREGFVFKRTVK